jgi:type IV secretory pathway TrbL component
MKRLQFGKVNKILILISVILLIVGYAIMATGDDVISPIILTITYIGIIPFSILYKPKN